MNQLKMGILLPIVLFSFTSNSFAKNLQISLYGSGNIAALDGYLQIPAGGKVGSSSPKRPTFEELNLNSTTFYKLGLTLDWPWLGFYGEYQHIRPTSEATLEQSLVSHALTLPANTKISTDNRFDLFRLGMRHKIKVLNILTIYPALELTGLDFSYAYTTNKVSSSRAFHSATERIGIGADFILTPALTLNANVASSVPNTTNLQVQTAELTASYALLNQNRFTTSVYAGIGYERIHFQDKQLMPNDILMNAPYGELGLKFTLK